MAWHSPRRAAALRSLAAESGKSSQGHCDDASNDSIWPPDAETFEEVCFRGGSRKRTAD